ncbi:MAG: hypothetical protein WCO84_05890 [bacterium]
MDLCTHGNFQFNLSKAIWTSDPTLGPVHLYFPRPGDLTSPLAFILPEIAQPKGFKFPSLAIIQIETDARTIYEHLTGKKNPSPRVPTLGLGTLRNLQRFAENYQISSQSLSGATIKRIYCHPSIAQDLLKLLDGITPRSGNSSIRSFMDLGQTIEVQSDPKIRPDLITLVCADGNTLNYQIGQGESRV